MHLVCLGIMKKLLVLWQRPKMNHSLPAFKIDAMSDKLLKMKKFTPSEFCRKPKSLKYYTKWKATEYRQFLLYTGYFVMKDVVHKSVLSNFVSLLCAIRLLCKGDDLDYAHKLLEHFVLTFKILYFKENMSFNVHSLLHLTDDVKEHGTLDTMSAFKFENYLFKLKQLVSKTNLPLQQIHNRYKEGAEDCFWEAKSDGILESSQHKNGPLPAMLSPDIPQYTRAYVKNALLNTRGIGNKCFLLKNNTAIMIENIFTVNNSAKIYGKCYKSLENVFEEPMESGDIGIYLLKNKTSHNEIHDLSSVKTKLYILPYPTQNELAAVEIMHI
ncbi:uncharacterized protein LOC108253796 [Diaphorina citri]|uniref:Uncharacterized protein LOC108253796 n=1 Tax=Diaphorina citri TaxID=121845 RepID=A0A1S4EP15_DIACI|nr:uncharacterized protein LOC108253796 [Diaphorina citri]